MVVMGEAWQNAKNAKFVDRLEGSIWSAKQAFNIPEGDSTKSADEDYMQEVGRLVLELYSELYEEI